MHTSNVALVHVEDRGYVVDDNRPPRYSELAAMAARFPTNIQAKKFIMSLTKRYKDLCDKCKIVNAEVVRDDNYELQEVRLV